MCTIVVWSGEIKVIPKIIHYCWFGHGKKTVLSKKCIASWKKYCPDYTIIEWNESNIDLNMNQYTKMCYEEKKYAFLADYIRLIVVEKYGGIYLDTDVEVVRPLDDLLLNQAFIGYEVGEYINTGGGFGAEAGNVVVQQMINEYDHFLDGQHGVEGCPILNTRALLKLGLKQDGKMQNLKNVMIYPVEYFSPFNYGNGKLSKTENTYTIHWFAMSWLDKKTVLRCKITKPIHRLFGNDCFSWLKKTIN